MASLPPSAPLFTSTPHSAQGSGVSRSCSSTNHSPLSTQRHSHTTHSPTPSVGSNDSWDMSVRCLSNSLSQICSSPTTSCGDLTAPPLDETDLPKVVKHRSVRRSLDETVRSIGFTPHKRSTTPDICADVSSQELFISTINRMCKKIRVRHEQSSKKLHEQLALICGRISHDTLSSFHEDTTSKWVSKPQRPVIRRESMKRGLKINVNIGDVSSYHVCVQISANELNVLKFTGKGQETVYSEVLSDSSHGDVDVEKIMCLVDSNELDIKQYPKKYLDIDYPESSAKYLPIMHEDDVGGLWHMMLYIPDSYDTKATRLQVKTVDDKLVVSWWDNNRTHGMSKLMMDLPHNVVTRSVSGVVSKDDQLIIEAFLSSTRDRCSTF